MSAETLTSGTALPNGTSGVYARAMNWGETITILRRDVQCYGVDRWLVADSHGRHGWAH